MHEPTLIKVAQDRLEALKIIAANHVEYLDVHTLYCELKGIVDLRYIDDLGLSKDSVDELILIENLASLTMRSVNPEALKIKTEQGDKLDSFMAMPERKLADLIFKEGGRFNNPEAVSVAMHRGIIDDVKNEQAAYQRIAQRESEQHAN